MFTLCLVTSVSHLCVFLQLWYSFVVNMMAKGTIYCCVPSCESSRDSTIDNKTVFQKDREAVTFHRFPKNIERHTVWARKCFGEEYVDNGLYVHYNKRNTYVCSKHFTTDDFTETFVYGELLKYSSKKILKISAVPSLKLPDHAAPSVPNKTSIKSEFDHPTFPKHFMIKSQNCPVDKSPISEKLRKLREEGQKRIAQLIKENEEIFKCSIHKVTSPACSIENCVLRPKRRKKAAYYTAPFSFASQTACVDFSNDIETETYADNIITIEEAQAEIALYNSGNNSLTESLDCLDTFKEEVTEDSKQLVQDEYTTSDKHIITSSVIPDDPSNVNEFQVLQVDKDRKFVLKYCGKPASNLNQYIVDGSDFISLITESNRHGNKRTKPAESHHTGKRLRATSTQPVANAEGVDASNGVDVPNQFSQDTSQLRLPQESAQLDLKSEDNSGKTKPSKGDLGRHLNLSQTAVCNAHGVMACNVCITRYNASTDYVIESVKSEKYDFQRAIQNNSNTLGGNSLIRAQENRAVNPVKSLSDKRSAFQSGSHVLSNPIGGHGSAYRLIRPKVSPPQANPSPSSSVHLVRGKLSNKLDKLKKIDQLISENNILISNLALDTGKRKCGAGGDGKHVLGAVQSAGASGSNNNKENTAQFCPLKTTVPPPLVPIGSGTLGQYEQTLMEQTNLIQRLVDRVNKLEEENERLKRVERENEYLKRLLNERGNSLNEQGNSFNERGNRLNERENSLDEQGNSLDDQGNSLDEQGNSLNERGNSLNEQGNRLNEQGKAPNQEKNFVQNTTRLEHQEIFERHQAKKSVLNRKEISTRKQKERALLREQEKSAFDREQEDFKLERKRTNLIHTRQGTTQNPPKNLSPEFCQEQRNSTPSEQELVCEQERRLQGDETVEITSDSYESSKDLKQGKVAKAKSLRRGERISDNLSRRDKRKRIHQELQENSSQSYGAVQHGCKSDTQKGLKRQEPVVDNSSIDCVEIDEADNIGQSTADNDLEENLDLKSPLLEASGEIAIEDRTEIIEEILPDFSEYDKIAHDKCSDNANSAGKNARRKGVDEFNANKSNSSVKFQEHEEDIRSPDEMNVGLASGEHDELHATIDENTDHDDLNQTIDEMSDIGEHIGDKHGQLTVENDQILSEVDGHIQVLSGTESNTNEMHDGTYIIPDELNEVSNMDGELDSSNIIESNVIHVFDETTSEHCEAYFVVQSSTGGLSEVQVIRNDSYVGYTENNIVEGEFESEAVRFEQTVTDTTLEEDSGERLEHNDMLQTNLEVNS